MILVSQAIDAALAPASYTPTSRARERDGKGKGRGRRRRRRRVRYLQGLLRRRMELRVATTLAAGTTPAGAFSGRAGGNTDAREAEVFHLTVTAWETKLKPRSSSRVGSDTRQPGAFGGLID